MRRRQRNPWVTENRPRDETEPSILEKTKPIEQMSDAELEDARKQAEREYRQASEAELRAYQEEASHLARTRAQHE